MYQLQYIKTLDSAHRVYLCVPYSSNNKQRLFSPNSINWFGSVVETMCFP
jgi:hypothetical protein